MPTSHTLMLVLAGLITACQFVASNFPGTTYATIAHAIAGIAASFLPYLGATSPQMQLPGASAAPSSPAPVAPVTLPVAAPVVASVQAAVAQQTASGVAALEASAPAVKA